MDEKAFDDLLSDLVSEASITKLPDGVNSRRELVLCYLLHTFLLKFHPDYDQSGIKTFISDLGRSITLKEIETYIEHIDQNRSTLFEKDVMGSWLQHSLSPEMRKKLAMNFTVDISHLLDKYVSLNQGITVMDAFCGSGRLITELINCDISVRYVRINDINPTAVLLAICRILEIAPNIEINASIGSAFDKTLGKFDCIIINPPFTRAMRIDETAQKLIRQRLELDNLGHQGLHIYSLLLMHETLKKDGVLIAVLPGSTFGSTYSAKIQDIFLNNYSGLKIIMERDRQAFSENSEFNELLIIAHKGDPSEEVEFINHPSSSLKVKTSILKDDWNWMRYFRSPDLHLYHMELINQLNLQNAGKSKLDIIRGIELYGPHFYFFPNKFHSLLTEQGHYTEMEDECKIPKLFLHPILRQPKLYKTAIVPDINEKVLVIPKNYEELLDVKELKELEKYISTHQEQAEVAKRRFGDDYLHHTFLQIRNKCPEGHAFIIDKLDLGSAVSLCYYNSDQTLATKNFYIIKEEDNENMYRIKLVAAWMNSSYFLLLYLASRREISGRYGRMQIIDYYKEPLFPKKLLEVDEDLVCGVINSFDDLCDTKLPKLSHRHALNSRKSLDNEFKKLFGLKINLEDIYTCIDNVFDDLKP